MKSILPLLVCTLAGAFILHAADSPSKDPAPASSKPAAATPLPDDAPKEIREAVEWFDGLGYPSVKGLTRVRVTDESFEVKSENKNKNKHVSHLDGWLLEEKGGQWRLLCGPDPEGPFFWDGEDAWPLSKWTVSEYDKVTDGWRSVRRITTTDFNAETEAALANFKEDQKKDWKERGASDRFGKVLSQRAAFFILGRDCLQLGNTGTGMKLLKEAPPIMRDVNEKRSFQKLLADEFSQAALWRITLDFSAAKIPRATILADLEAALKQFPSAYYTERMKEMAKRLRTMVAEDREHAAKVKPFEQMTKKEQVAELIFQLRDQNGAQDGQPGWCDIFAYDTWRKEDAEKEAQPSPAMRLVNIGYAAVPALMEALGSETYSRSVGFHRDFHFSHTVLTVGDCALTTLSRIANRSFYRPKTTSSYMSRDKEVAETKAEVEKWWKSVEKKGERQALIDATAAGDQHSPGQAAVLREKYPDDAAAAILKGAASAADWWPRTQMIGLMKGLETKEVIVFLRKEMKESPHADARMAALKIMTGQDRDAAVKAMSEEWARLPGGVRRNDRFDEKTGRFIGEGGDFDESEWRNRIEHCLKLIYLAGGAEPVKTVMASYWQKPAWVRPVIVRVAFKEELERYQDDYPVMPEKERAAAEEAMEALLMTALEDSKDRARDDATRTCDDAAEILHERWPDKYAFERVDSVRRRDEQIIAIKNVRRAAAGQKPLPVPAPPQIPAADEAKTKPMLDALAAAPDKETVAVAILMLESSPGLSALPLVRKRLEALAKDDPQRERWQQATARLASIVRTLEIDPKAEYLLSCEPLKELKGKALTPERFQAALVAMYQCTPKDVSGFLLKAAREADGTGFEIRVEPLAEKSSGTDDWWSEFRLGSRLENPEGSNRGYYGTAGIGKEKDDFEEFIKYFVKVTAKGDGTVYVKYHTARQAVR